GSGGSPSSGGGSSPGSSRVTCRTTLALLPRSSLAVTVITLSPIASGTSVANAPAASAASGAPFRPSVTGPLSDTFPATVAVAASVVMPSAGDVSASIGGSVSSCTVSDCCDTLPAASVAITSIVLS